MLRPLFSVLLGATLLLGLAVPLGFTALAGLLLPGPAGGSLVERDGQVVGSSLIGQDFSGPQWFHGRPSATAEADPENPGTTRARPYNAASSAASQLGPTSAALRDAVVARIDGGRAVPADAATASGSGLDPHISPANATAQIARVALARRLPTDRLAALVRQHTQGRELGLLGEPRVDVLALNLALERLR